MKKAFTLLEILIVTALIGAVAMYTAKNYLNISVLTSTAQTTKIKSDLTLITSIVMKCVNDSANFPKNSDGSISSGDILRDLECKSTTPYAIDGTSAGFIPKLDNEFSDWNATESGSSFFITTSATKDSSASKVLENISNAYSPNQVVYDTNTSTTKNILNFYIYK